MISPDLSTQDPTRIVPSGGIVAGQPRAVLGRARVRDRAVAAAEGADLGRAPTTARSGYTRQGGGAWTDVTKNITGMPRWGTDRRRSSRRTSMRARRTSRRPPPVDNRAPFIYKTTDFGADVEERHRRSAGDASARLRARGHREPEQARACSSPAPATRFYYSMDDGAHWTQFKDGLPAAPVSWVVVRAALSRRRRLHLRARALHPRRHHAARADRAADGAGADDEAVRAARRASGRRAADRRSSCSRWRRAPAGPLQLEILNARGQVIRTQRFQARAPGSTARRGT